MKITFSYDNDYRPTLSTVSADGVKLDIQFENLEPYLVVLAEMEYEPIDDNLNGLFIRFEKSTLVFEMVSVAEILRQAVNQIEEAIAEDEREARDEYLHSMDPTGLNLSGRV